MGQYFKKASTHGRNVHGAGASLVVVPLLNDALQLQNAVRA